MELRKCKYCKKTFSFRACPSDIKSGRGIYCSRACVNKARVFTPEIRKKMRKARLGKTPWNKGLKGYTISHKGKLRPSIQGSGHWNWRGGVTKETNAFRISLPYRRWREEVFRRDNYTCVICGKRGGDIEADHIRPMSLFKELSLRVKNGRTLCIDCHGVKTRMDHLFIKGRLPITLLKEATLYTE